MLGPWAGAGDAGAAVSLLDGIRAAVSPGTRVLHAAGTAIEGGSRTGFDEAIAAARAADVVVLCLGESAIMSGEAASRAGLALPGRQDELARAVIATGRPVVVTLTSGRPLAVPDLAATATALLQTWFLGHEAGNAVADVLFGDWNPSARLAVTFPRHPGQVPLYYGHRRTGRPPGPGRYTSKYQDGLSGPLYPFGWGQSYTSFHYGPPRLAARELAADGTLDVAVDVTNGGPRAGETTVQLYVHDPVASVARPVLELRGVAKLRLEPGATATARLELRAADLAFLRADGTVGSEPGRIEVLVGPSSVELQATSFTLKP
jgi:beta-glucosidase